MDTVRVSPVVLKPQPRTALPRISVLRRPAFPHFLLFQQLESWLQRRWERLCSITDGTLCQWSGDFSQRRIWRTVKTASTFVPPLASLHRVHVRPRAAWQFIAFLELWVRLNHGMYDREHNIFLVNCRFRKITTSFKTNVESLF